ncbi:MAG: hypothetical protein ACHQIG_08440 [Acidimicrobiia bacterium]
MGYRGKVVAQERARVLRSEGQTLLDRASIWMQLNSTGRALR